MQINHVDAFTVEEAEHQIATRLYQNTAKVHFNQHAQSQTPRGKRLIYGGVAISLARAHRVHRPRQCGPDHRDQRRLHVNPLGSGDTVYAGRKCWTRRTWATGSARCACVWWRPRTGPAAISPTKTPKANTRRT